MATVTGLTAERMLNIEAASVVSGTINASGRLILTKHDGTQIDAGSALVSVPAKSLVQFLSMPAFVETTLPASYPEGMSLLTMDNNQATANWPTFAGKWGAVRTVKWAGNDTFQTWNSHGGSGSTAQQWVRVGNTNMGWSTWKKLALSDEVTAVDGRVTTVEGRATTVEGRATTLEGRATSLEGRATTVEGRATTLESRLGPIYAIQCGNGTVPTATVTALGYGAAPLSPANGYVRATNRITVPSAGAYRVAYRYKLGGSVGAGRAFVELTVASLANYQYTIPADTTTFGRSPVGEGEDVGVVTSTVNLTVGAQIGVNAFQSSGTAKSIDGVLNVQRIS